MARTVSSTNNFVYPATWSGTPPVTAQPVTMACWARFSGTTSQNLMFAATDGTIYLGMSLSYVTTGRIGAVMANGGAEVIVETTSGITTNTWHHCAVAFASSTSRTVYLDGGSSNSNSTTCAPTGAVNIALGCFRNHYGSQYGPMSGQLAEACMWNVALSADEILALAKGVPTNLIRPASIAAYWPLHGIASPEPDYKPGILTATRYPMTLVGSPTAYAGHAPVIHVFPLGDISFLSSEEGGLICGIFGGERGGLFGGAVVR